MALDGLILVRRGTGKTLGVKGVNREQAIAGARAVCVILSHADAAYERSESRETERARRLAQRVRISRSFSQIFYADRNAKCAIDSARWPEGG